MIISIKAKILSVMLVIAMTMALIAPFSYAEEVKTDIINEIGDDGTVLLTPFDGTHLFYSRPFDDYLQSKGYLYYYSGTGASSTYYIDVPEGYEGPYNVEISAFENNTTPDNAYWWYNFYTNGVEEINGNSAKFLNEGNQGIEVWNNYSLGTINLKKGKNKIGVGFSVSGVDTRKLFIGLRSIKLTPITTYSILTNAVTLGNGTVSRIVESNNTSNNAATDDYLLFCKSIYNTNDDRIKLLFDVSRAGWYSLYADIQPREVVDFISDYSFYFDDLLVNGERIVANKCIDYLAVPSNQAPYKRSKIKFCDIYLNKGINNVEFGIFSNRNSNMIWLYGVSVEYNSKFGNLSAELYYSDGRKAKTIDFGDVLTVKGIFKSDDVICVKIYTVCYKNGRVSKLYIDDITSFKSQVEPEKKFDIRTFEVPECDEIKIMTFSKNMRPVTLANAVVEKKMNNIDLYVDEKRGNDNNNGESRDKAVATIKRALDIVASNDNSNTINIAEGFYNIDSELVINETHANYKKNLIIRGDGNKRPIISGGYKISGWSKTSENPNIYKAVIPQEINDVTNLFINGFAAQRARTSITYEATEFLNDNNTYNEDRTISNFNNDGIVMSSIPDGLVGSDNVTLVFNGSWASQAVVAESINNVSGKYEIKLRNWKNAYNIPHSNTRPYHTYIRNFYFENALSLLDEAGEYYFDNKTNTIYYYPFENENMSNVDSYVGVLEKLVTIKGSSLDSRVSDITLENLDFRHSTWKHITENGYITELGAVYIDSYGKKQERPSAFEVINTDNLLISNCAFINIGATALSLESGVTNSRISKNIFRDIAGSGIKVSRSMSFYPSNSIYALKINGYERPTNITVDNNLIRRIGQVYNNSIGIEVYVGANINVVNNDIADVPYSGISLGYGWDKLAVKDFGYNSVVANRVDNVMCVRNDGGHIYVLGVQPSTVVNENYLTKSGDVRGGLYFDDGTDSVTATKNVVEMSRGANNGYWIYLWKDTIHISATGNYSDTTRYLKNAPESVVQDNKCIKSEWENQPLAMEIMNNAGIEAPYRAMLNEDGVNMPEWRKNHQLEKILVFH